MWQHMYYYRNSRFHFNVSELNIVVLSSDVIELTYLLSVIDPVILLTIIF